MVIGSTLEAVRAKCLRPAYIGVIDDIVLVYARDDEDGAGGEALSTELNCVTLAMMVHDSDLFGYIVHDRGTLIAQMITPDPSEYFGMDMGESEACGTSADLVATLGRGSVERVDAALDGSIDYADELHVAFLDALGLPTGGACYGFVYIEHDDCDYDGPELQLLD
jgi:hypothetical protein